MIILRAKVPELILQHLEVKELRKKLRNGKKSRTRKQRLHLRMEMGRSQCTFKEGERQKMSSRRVNELDKCNVTCRQFGGWWSLIEREPG